MKRIIRTIALLLTLITPLSSVACANPNSPADDTTLGPSQTESPENTEAPATTVDDRYDDEGYLKSNLPDELDFGGEEVTILWWTDVERPEFFVDNTSGDIISDAIFKRNANVEEKMGITLAWDSTKGQYNNGVGAAYAKYVGNSYEAGDATWDIISAHSRTIALTSQYGYCTDLTELDYLDFEMPWWPKAMTESAKIGDALYYVTGDCSTNALHMLYTIFFNKDIMENRHLTDPTSLVLEGKWTMENMQLLTKDLYQDIDNNGYQSANDFYGLTSLDWHFDAVFYGAGLLIVESDAENLFKISDTYFSEKASNLCAMLGKWFDEGDTFIDSDKYRVPFENGNAFMVLTRHKDVVDNIVDSDLKFGAVPVPKYDEQQKNHITCVGNPVSFYSIYALSEDTNRAAAVLECWASEAYRTTTPAIFEQTFKLRYSDSSVESQMYDIMRSGIVFDIGRFYAAQLSSPTDLFVKAAMSGQSWTTITKAYTKTLNNSLNKIISAYQKIQG